MTKTTKPAPEATHKMYDEHKVSNETKFMRRADGGQMFSHHVMTLHDKPLLTNIKLEPHRAASLNNQAHNRLRYYHEHGQPLPVSIRREKEMDENGFETGKWRDSMVNG